MRDLAASCTRQWLTASHPDEHDSLGYWSTKSVVYNVRSDRGVIQPQGSVLPVGGA